MTERPYVQTFTIVAGSEACNATCPYCISKMTPSAGLGIREPEVNWRNFNIGAGLAKDWGAATVLITGKGESTLFPKQITRFISELRKHEYRLIELQTNGIYLAQRPEYDHYSDRWYDEGLTTIALSMVHHDSNKNGEIFQRGKEPYDIIGLIDKLHDKKFSVRLSCIMLKDYIDSPEGIEELVDFSKAHGVEQLTVRSVSKPEVSRDSEIEQYVEDHKIPRETIDELRNHFDKHGTRLRELVHGAIVYDYKGQNLCLSNCLTTDSKEEAIRQVIFFPDGHVRYDWQYTGAILL